MPSLAGERARRAAQKRELRSHSAQARALNDDAALREAAKAFGVSDEAEWAYADLMHGTSLAREQGEPVPCLGPGAEAWTSEDATDQELAADLCLLCPVFALCQRYADAARPEAGTWAGVTRHQPRPHRPNAPHAASRQVHAGAGCRCGCGGSPRTAAYLPGHDSRHLSALLGAVRGGSLSLNAALAELAHSERLQAKFSTYLGKV